MDKMSKIKKALKNYQKNYRMDVKVNLIFLKKLLNFSGKGAYQDDGKLKIKLNVQERKCNERTEV